MENDRERSSYGCSLESYLSEPTITEGQRRRLRLLQTVEEVISDRVERLCVPLGIEVTDVAALVIAPSARELFFRATELVDGDGRPPGASVLLGHREKLHAFLHAVLPPTDDAPFDPYADLLDPSPPRCIRVLIVDDESLTVLNYGAFVTLSLDLEDMPQA